MLIPGIAPGSVTQDYLVNLLIVVRLIGAVCMIVLYAASKSVDHWMYAIAGIRISVVELLIVTGTLTSSAQIVRSFC